MRRITKSLLAGYSRAVIFTKSGTGFRKLIKIQTCRIVLSNWFKQEGFVFKTELKQI